MPVTVSLEIPPRSAYVGVVRLTVASLARSAGLEEEAVEDLKIAVSEACANAVIANEEAGREDAVVVEWHDDDSRIEIGVGDSGPAERAAAGDTDTDGISSRLAMSLALLNSLVDECRFEPREGGGMKTLLVISH